MKCIYCPTCGSETRSRLIGDDGRVPYCVACDLPLFDLAAPCVLVVAVNDNGQLLLLRQHYVSTDHWVLVAGYNQLGETAEDTVRREVAEETGLSVQACTYVGSYYHQPKSALMLGFLAEVRGELSSVSNEVDDLAWVEPVRARELMRPGSIGRRLVHEALATNAGQDEHEGT